MSYDPGIPQAGHTPAADQPQILQNFIQLNTQFGAEHNAFNSAAHDGKHKCVTLPVGTGIVPAGTDMVLSQALTAGGNAFLQYRSATKVYNIELGYTALSVVFNGTTTILDFAAAGLPPQFGYINGFDPTVDGRQVFSPFIWRAGVLHVPGSSAQLVAGVDFIKFRDNSGSKLQLDAVGLGGGGSSIRFTITGNAI